MPDFPFPGYPAYVEAAAKAMGRPIRMDGFAKVSPLVMLANLCSQAIGLDPTTMCEVLDRAREFRDQLEVALSAADAILGELDALHLEKLDEFTKPPSDPTPDDSNRKGNG